MANRARKRVDEIPIPMQMVGISPSERQKGANLSIVSAAAGENECSNRNKVVNVATTTTSYRDEGIPHQPRANNEGEEDDKNVIEARRKRHKCGRQRCESWSLFSPSPGGPHDIIVIPSFGGHVARHIWDGTDRGVLNCLSRGKALEQLRDWRFFDEVALDLVIDSGLSHLIDCMFEHLDMPLLSAFVERWQPDTNTFHLPFGEMTIMLHDVFYILGLPVDGIVVDNKFPGGQWSDLCKLLNLDCCNDLPSSQVINCKAIWSKDGVLLDGILQKCSHHNVTSKNQAGGYLLYLLGSTLFVDNSGDRMSDGFTAIMRDADRVSEYAWGAATLAYLYRQLGIATRADAFEICGCLTLLQAWIYEYFPIFRPARGRQLQSDEPLAKLWNLCEASKRDIDSLRLYRIQLDQLTSKQVTWLPYGQDPSVNVPRTIFTGFLRCLDVIEPYHPDRVLRQLGYIQVVPAPASLPERDSRCREPRKYSVNFPAKHINIMWLNGRFHQLSLSDFEEATDPSTVSADYMDWYYQVSHPFLINDYNGRSSFLWMSELVKRLQPALSWPQEQRHETVKELFATLDDVGEFVQLWHQACNGPGAAPPSFPPPTLR